MFVLKKHDINAIRSRLPYISDLQRSTKEKVDQMAIAIADANFPATASVIVNGSYARQEASAESDLDFSVLVENSSDSEAATQALERARPRLLEIAARSPSTEGAFGNVHTLDALLSNIGGNDDSNQAITRRVLFLLEGLGISNPTLAGRFRERLLGEYIKTSITPHQIALFLLNDIIRYYRTICVDFEFKTSGCVKVKPWGTRNIKLIFSRKLLYFSGLLAVAETAQCSRETKLSNLTGLFDMPVVDRIIACCGNKSISALRHYQYFLQEISNPETRMILNAVHYGNPEGNTKFRELKDCGHHFSWELLVLLRESYEASHPIHRAIVM